MKTPELRARGTSGLTKLLLARPDLADPLPIDLPDLVARANSVPSLTRALGRLDQPRLRVLVGLAAQLPDDQLGIPSELAAAVAEFAELGLVTGAPPRPIASVERLLGPYPAGLAPASAQPVSAQQISAALQQITTAEQAIVDRLAWGPPHGQLSDAYRTVDLQTATTPIDRLLALGLLRPVADDTVIMPREVAIALRGGRVFDTDTGRPVLPQFETPTDHAPAVSAEQLATWLLAQPDNTDWQAILSTAARDDLWVQLIYATEDGTTCHEIVRVLFVGHGSAYLVRRAGRRLTIPVTRIISASSIERVVISDLPPG